MIYSRMKNLKVVAYSVIALGFLVLAFFVHWMFIIGAVFLSYLSQRELFPKEIKKKNDKNKQV